MTKIEALEKTIYNLENDVYEYNWWDNDTCNCGVLVRTILNGEKPNSCGMFDVTETAAGFGGMVIKTLETCSQTGIPLPKVYQALKDCGFTGNELDKLEDCSYDKNGVIKYLKAWVEILKEEKPNSEQEVKECDATMSKKVETVGSKIIHVYHKVEIPETIQESLPETILS